METFELEEEEQSQQVDAVYDIDIHIIPSRLTSPQDDR